MRDDRAMAEQIEQVIDMVAIIPTNGEYRLDVLRWYASDVYTAGTYTKEGAARGQATHMERQESQGLKTIIISSVEMQVEVEKRNKEAR